MSGVVSLDELLTVGPRLTGVPHSSSVVARVVTYRSRPPDPPGLSEAKKSHRPSAEMLGPASLDELLTVGPRFIGVPVLVKQQSDHCRTVETAVYAH